MSGIKNTFFGDSKTVRIRPVNLLMKYNTVLIFVLLIIVSSIISNSFLTFKNISNLLRQNSGIAIVSMGMLLVILTGGIDLSVGSVVALGCVLTGYFLQFLPLPLAILFTALVCMLSGIGAGYFVAFRNVAPFVVTLAFMTITRGIAFIVSKGTPIRITNQGLIYFGRETILGLPCLAYLILIVFVVFGILLKFTVFGRLITAIGSNESAVRLSGITVQIYKFVVYVMSALVCMLSGIGAGYFVAFRNVAPFVVTLAFMTITRGIAFIISKGTPIRITNQGLIYFGRETILGLPCLAYLILIVFVVFGMLLKFTVFGRLITAIGSNESAVRLSGIRVQIYKFIVYVLSALVCSFAGAISASRAAVGSPIVGSGMELDAIASVVIGGAALSGGRGSILNTLLGVFILGMIGNIMNLMNVAAYPQQVIKGVIILVAVLLQGAEEGKEK
jgi:ribose transport system permease protein